MIGTAVFLLAVPCFLAERMCGVQFLSQLTCLLLYLGNSLTKGVHVIFLTQLHLRKLLQDRSALLAYRLSHTLICK